MQCPCSALILCLNSSHIYNLNYEEAPISKVKNKNQESCSEVHIKV